VSARFLADKSALARWPQPAVDRVLAPLILTGAIARCSIIDLELLYSARSHADFLAIAADRLALPAFAIEQRDFDRAIAVMELLARRGQHRGAGIPDLLVAAVAERHGLGVLHYDADFDTIAGVTKQRTQWVVARGSVP